MKIWNVLKKLNRSQRIGLCTLAVFAVGVLCLFVISYYQTHRELAEETAAWQQELEQMAVEEAERLNLDMRPRMIGSIELTGDGQPLPVTVYMPTKISDISQMIDLGAQIRSMGPAPVLPEGTKVVLELADDEPASIMIWRSPIGAVAPAESVNYTREVLDSGTRCEFTVSYGAYESVDYIFDIKIDNYNQGQIGFSAARPADAVIEEVTNG